MYVILLSFLALATAAPHYRPYFSPYLQDSDYGLGENLLDLNKFWQELELEIQKMDKAISEMTKQFPINTSCNEGVDGNEYKITIGLNGFEEKDITVKAKEGVLLIQAVRTSEDGDQKTYVDLRTLPSYILPAGSWTYDQEVLKIVFPLKNKPETETTVAPTEVETTPAPVDHSREEMGEHGKENGDADVGLRGDRDREEIETNEISNGVEATTYAVDYKNEVEFVPMKYRK